MEAVINTRQLRRIVVSGLLTIGMSVGVALHADECNNPPEPIALEAVCGQTVFRVGWRAPGRDSDMLAEIAPEVPLQLVDAADHVIAEVTSDKKGGFRFPPVVAGKYRLRANDPIWFFNWPISVTRSNRPCSRLLYAYVTVGVCGTDASLTRPADIKCSLCNSRRD